MKVFIKNKLFSVRGSSVVQDENGRDAYRVKGKFFSVTAKKFICDLDGNTLYTVRNKWFNFFHTRAYVYDADRNKVACVKKPFMSVKKFVLEGYKDEITINGDFFSMQSSITRNGQVVGTITRQFTIVKDAFTLEADEADMPFMIALVIAIDNIWDKINKRR